MIRLVQRRLIIPRGDTGTFSVPVLSSYNSGDAAVFSIIDPRTHRRVYNQLMYVTDNVLSVKFEYGDTVNLPVGKFLWDIKFYQDPIIEDNQVVSGKEVDSYYAAFTMPECEIRQTGDNMLTADDAPGSTLTPQHINAINAALFALNEAVEKTETNVTHYPTIIDGEWNVWDANLGDYTTTGIEATGNGIASIEKTNTEGLVDTYTVNFTDGTTFLYNITNGDRGIGISSISKGSTSGLVDTYVIAYTDGTSTSFTVTNGAIPNISIGTVQEGSIAAASITGDAANPVLNLTLPNANVPTRVSELENDANYAVDANYVHTDNNYTTAEKEKLNSVAVGAEVNVNADWNANSGDAQILNKPTNVSAFTNDTGYLTEHQDLSDYVQKTDYATRIDAGIVKIGAGLALDGSFLTIYKASNNQIQRGTAEYSPIVPAIQERSTFYGLAKAAGDTTQNQSSNAVGTYTNEAKAAIQTMLDVPSNADIPTQVSELTNDAGYLTTETDPTVPAWAKAANKPTYTAAEVGAPTVAEMQQAIANVNTMKIHICAQGEYNAETGVPTVQNPDAQTFYLVPGGEGSNLFIEWVYVNNSWERFGSADVEIPVQDVQVNGTSILDAQGVANVPIADAFNKLGVVKVTNYHGLQFESGELRTLPANDTHIKSGVTGYAPIIPLTQHMSTFYGLAKAAGSDEKDSTLPVGQYTDDAKAAIQHMLGTDTNLGPYESDTTADAAYAIGEMFMLNGKLHKATAAIAVGDTFTVGTNCAVVSVSEVFPHDVQVNGVSVLSDGVANVPRANSSTFGVVCIGIGLRTGGANNVLLLEKSTDANIKAGNEGNRAIVSSVQHMSAFYGLAKAAGDTTQSESSNAVGTYTDDAKAAISQMLNGSVAVTGSTPTITALPGIRYVCGEVLTLDITLPVSGIVDVVFESGSTATVLTITPPTGMTVKWANGFDPTSLETNTTYEINIADGLGVAATWN